jgi:hypothetical protein
MTHKELKMSDELIYIRNAGNHPVGAVAVRVESPTSVRLAVSKCNPMDSFERPVARNRALGRLNSDTHSKVFTSAKDKAVDEFLMDYHLTNPQISKAVSFIERCMAPRERSAES